MHNHISYHSSFDANHCLINYDYSDGKHVNLFVYEKQCDYLYAFDKVLPLYFLSLSLKLTPNAASC